MGETTNYAGEAIQWARAATNAEVLYAATTSLHIEANGGERATHAAAKQEAYRRGLIAMPNRGQHTAQASYWRAV